MSVWEAWTWSAVAVTAGIVVGVGVVSAIGVFLLEAQRRRDQRASALQDCLAEPIARELGATGVSVLPTVHIPLWDAATNPAVIQLDGVAPSEEVHDRVVRVAEREASRLRYFRIEDRIRIVAPARKEVRRRA